MTDRKNRDDNEPELSRYAPAGLARSYPGTDLVAALTALICLRYLTDPNEALADGTDDVMAALRERAADVDPGDELLLSEIRDIPEDAGWVARLVDELVESAWDCHQASERIMASRHRFGARGLFENAVTPELARLVAELSGARERVRRTSSFTVTGPAAGAGDLMMAVMDLLGADHEPRPTWQRPIIRLLPEEPVQVATRDELRAVLAGKAFSQRLAGLMRRYTNQNLATAEIIAALVALAREVSADARRWEQFAPPLSSDELAFYDAVAQNESAVTEMGSDKLIGIARDLVRTLRRDVTTDWVSRDDVRAKIRSTIKRLLAKWGYPPDQQQNATDLVLRQMETFAEEWSPEAA